MNSIYLFIHLYIYLYVYVYLYSMLSFVPDFSSLLLRESTTHIVLFLGSIPSYGNVIFCLSTDRTDIWTISSFGNDEYRYCQHLHASFIGHMLSFLLSKQIPRNTITGMYGKYMVTL